jgi:hypothetical protein
MPAVDRTQVVIGPGCNRRAVFEEVEILAEPEFNDMPAVGDAVEINC